MVYNLSRTQEAAHSSQNLRLQSDMRTSKTVLPNYTESKSSVEDIFDSGIQSGSNLSSGVISETDLKDADSCSDCEYNSDTLMKQSLKGASKNLASSGSCKLNVSTKLDSGIDIDWSDQYNYSKHDYQSADSSPLVVPDRDVSYFPISPAIFLPLADEHFWETYFEPDEDGNTLLHLAVVNGDEEYIRNIVRIIPKSVYLDIRNYYRQTCLHLSVLLNQPNISRLLLLAGAKTGVEDRIGNTPLHLACRLNFLECVEALVHPVHKYEQKSAIFKYKPAIDSPCKYINKYNYDGLSCVHMAAVHPDLKVLRQLFASGGDVNIQECKGGYTLLHSAVISGNLDLLSYILQLSDIDLEKKNYARLTPYQLSVYHPRIATILCANGASAEIMVDDESDDDDDDDDDDYSTDENDSDDDLFQNLQVDSFRVDQVQNLMHARSTNEPAISAL